ncbi:unnamed protein product, partial [marine sediment metagenome]
MPRSLPRLAEEGRVRADWEYAEWAMRVSRDAEDMRWTTDEEAWREHIAAKYHFSPDPFLAGKQRDALWDKGIMKVWEDMPRVGIVASTRYSPKGYYFQYKDMATGRFTRRANSGL